MSGLLSKHFPKTLAHARELKQTLEDRLEKKLIERLSQMGDDLAKRPLTARVTEAVMNMPKHGEFYSRGYADVLGRVKVAAISDKGFTGTTPEEWEEHVKTVGSPRIKRRMTAMMAGMLGASGPAAVYAIQKSRSPFTRPLVPAVITGLTGAGLGALGSIPFRKMHERELEAITPSEWRQGFETMKRRTGRDQSDSKTAGYSNTLLRLKVAARLPQGVTQLLNATGKAYTNPGNLQLAQARINALRSATPQAREMARVVGANSPLIPKDFASFAPGSGVSGKAAVKVAGY